MTFSSLVSTVLISGILRPLVFLAFAVALVLFLWGLVRYMSSVDKDEGKRGARSLMLWGVIILAVMASVWGLVGIVTKTFFPMGVDTAPTVPSLR